MQTKLFHTTHKNMHKLVKLNTYLQKDNASSFVSLEGGLPSKGTDYDLQIITGSEHSELIE